MALDLKNPTGAPDSANQTEPTAGDRDAIARAQATSRAAADKIGKPLDAPIAATELPGDQVMCNFPVPVTLTLNDRRRVAFSVGAQRVPKSLATDYENQYVKGGPKVKGMHWYLAAHKVQVIGPVPTEPAK